MLSADNDSREGLLQEEKGIVIDHISPQRSRLQPAIIIPWILTVFFFSTTILFAWQSQVSRIGTYETGFTTDFVSTTPSLPLKIIQKHFTNDLLFNATTQQLYNSPLSPTETQYIGPPSPALDATWHALLHDQYVAVSAPEAQQFDPEDRALLTYAGDQHYYFELSVFHNLHCLNEIRMALAVDYDHYHPGHHDDDEWGESRAHIDHCVDQIRQALQCHADLTPVPMKPVVGGPSEAYIGNGEKHTCRDFDAIREWVAERGKRKGWKALAD